MTKTVKKSLITLCLIMICMIIFSLKSYATDDQGFLDGLDQGAGLIVTLIAYGFAFLVYLACACISVIIAIFSGTTPPITVDKVLYNKIGFINLDFLIGRNGSYQGYGEQIAATARMLVLITISLQFLVLLYLIIRYIVKSAQDLSRDKGEVKKALVYWLKGVVILMGMYIYIFALLLINRQIVGALEKSGLELPTSYTPADLLSFPFTPTTLIVFMMGCMGFIIGIVMYIHYFKRAIKIGFMIATAPITVATYALDVVGDNNSQTFNAWLKNFTATVFVQPVHIFIFMATCSPLLGLAVSNSGKISEILTTLEALVFATFAIFFMNKAESLILGMFKAEKAGSLVGSVLVATELLKRTKTMSKKALTVKSSLTNKGAESGQKIRNGLTQEQIKKDKDDKNEEKHEKIKTFKQETLKEKYESKTKALEEKLGKTRKSAEAELEAAKRQNKIQKAQYKLAKSKNKKGRVKKFVAKSVVTGTLAAVNVGLNSFSKTNAITGLYRLKAEMDLARFSIDAIDQRIKNRRDRVIKPKGSTQKIKEEIEELQKDTATYNAMIANKVEATSGLNMDLTQEEGRRNYEEYLKLLKHKATTKLENGETILEREYKMAEKQLLDHLAKKYNENMMVVKEVQERLMDAFTSAQNITLEGADKELREFVAALVDREQIQTIKEYENSVQYVQSMLKSERGMGHYSQVYDKSIDTYKELKDRNIIIKSDDIKTQEDLEKAVGKVLPIAEIELGIGY